MTATAELERVAPLSETEALQPIQLTKGDVQRLIRLGIESGRSEASQLTANGRQSMSLGELKAWAAVIAQIPGQISNNTTPQAVIEARAIAKIMAGHAWGISPFEAQTLFHFIPDKNTGGAIVPGYKALLMRIKTSGKYDYEIVELDETKCTMRAKKLVGSSWVTMEPDITFTLEEAKNAGLYDQEVASGKAKYSDGNTKKKGAWEAYTKDKLLARATSRLFNRHCPELFADSAITIRTKEEIEDEEVAPPKRIEAPKSEADEPFSTEPQAITAEPELSEEGAEQFIEDVQAASDAGALPFAEEDDSLESLRADAASLLEEKTGGDTKKKKEILGDRFIGKMDEAAVQDLIGELTKL